ncbi:XdhC family protein [Rhizobium sp. SL86]|uniref:XdhC family protein n=1 Tax=Rhizobium sp. SL86 TaxID=2995148 RepID=UPI002273CD0C|nr:XdhC/CoxI family protein [Rhizobium sp. SL86]MCY1666637.1 XdhC/CoxI family protein [Rhizobium sp. SL86]
MQDSVDILDLVSQTKARGEPFAVATVVRTISVTAAKAGAKAVVLADGSISAGWIGGGCARGAVLKAAADAIRDGQPRLISIQPKDLLDVQQVKPGEIRDGVFYARNMCPSQGTMDVFVEPVLPRPHLAVLGASPVAVALVDIARRMGFFVTVCAPQADHAAFGISDRMVDGFDLPPDGARHGFIVIATQGRGDGAALKAVLGIPSRYTAFVGSRRKFAALRHDLETEGLDVRSMDDMRSPAGLDLGSITPDEIAFSIVAEMIEIRRRGQRNA